MTDYRSDTQPAAAGSTAPPSDGARALGQNASSAAASARDTVNEAASTAGDKASSLIDQAKAQAATALSGQKDGIADRIDELADAVHKSGAQFEGRQDWIAGAIERGATELGSLATALRENDLTSLVTQVQSIARRQPALFIGASLAAGFAVARLGKLVVADVSKDDLPTIPEVGHAQG